MDLCVCVCGYVYGLPKTIAGICIFASTRLVLSSAAFHYSVLRLAATLIGGSGDCLKQAPRGCWAQGSSRVILSACARSMSKMRIRDIRRGLAKLPILVAGLVNTVFCQNLQCRHTRTTNYPLVDPKYYQVMTMKPFHKGTFGGPGRFTDLGWQCVGFKFRTPRHEFAYHPSRSTQVFIAGPEHSNTANLVNTNPKLSIGVCSFLKLQHQRELRTSGIPNYASRDEVRGLEKPPRWVYKVMAELRGTAFRSSETPAVLNAQNGRLFP